MSIAQCETNTLVLGKSGSGKSYQLSTIAKKMISENKKVPGVNFSLIREEKLVSGNYTLTKNQDDSFSNDYERPKMN